MAFCYQDLLRWPEAEAAWRSAIAGNPAVPEWHYRLGKILASHGSAAASAPELEQAVKLAEATSPLPGWLYDAHLLLAEAVRGSNKPWRSRATAASSSSPRATARTWPRPSTHSPRSAPHASADVTR